MLKSGPCVHISKLRHSSFHSYFLHTAPPSGTKSKCVHIYLTCETSKSSVRTYGKIKSEKTYEIFFFFFVNQKLHVFKLKQNTDPECGRLSRYVSFLFTASTFPIYFFSQQAHKWCTTCWYDSHSPHFFIWADSFVSRSSKHLAAAPALGDLGATLRARNNL